jgi:hypothetical protein
MNKVKQDMIKLKKTLMVALLAMSLTVADALPVDKDPSYCTPYQLGDTGPGEGKIFYIDDSGCHGLEAKATDEINSLSWNDAFIAANSYGSGWHLPTKKLSEMLKILTRIV